MGNSAATAKGTGELGLPLCGDATATGSGNLGTGAASGAESNGGPDAGAVNGAKGNGAGHSAMRARAAWIGLLLVDVAASAIFWFCLLYCPDHLVGPSLGCLFAAMVLWRLWRLYSRPVDDKIPYSCGFVAANGKELFLVATMHISPRAPRDVKAVISGIRPDVAMIELDEERLDRLRDSKAQKRQQNRTEDLQQLRVRSGPSSEQVTVLTQRALWNAERCNESISGRVVFEPHNPYGIKEPAEETRGAMALVHRGSSEGELALFAQKAHMACNGGARGLLIINWSDELPTQRLGSGTLLGDLRVAIRTRNWGYPRIPALLLPQADGEELKRQCLEGSDVHAEFKVLPDSYPRRTLLRRLLQGCALIFSGIGILYWIIQCFHVRVGAEFTEAEALATAHGIPCVCIDVDTNKFWARMGLTLVPTPCNLAASLLSWLALPRVLAQVLFPPRANVDVLGSMLLHLASFPARTWVAFVIAATGASTVVTCALTQIGKVSELGAEETGAVSAQDRQQAQAWIMLLFEAYLFPQIYQAVAASRDEAMYTSIVKMSNELHARRLVAIVGAGHANGILRHSRTRGL